LSWARRLPVPYPVLLAAAGIAIGLVPGMPRLQLSAPVLLFGFVPPLVFEAALSFEQEHARGVLRPIALLATVGVGMTVLGVGVGAHFLLGFSWPAALLLGAIVSPTDPIAVVAVIRQVNAPPRLAALLEGESLFNDGTGVAVFAAVAASLVAGQPTVIGFAGRLLLITVLGVAAGAFAGGAAAALCRVRPALALPVSLFAAWTSFGLAQAFSGSGVLAVVTAGFMVARYGRVTEALAKPWGWLALVLNACLFGAVGLAFPTAGLVALAAAVAGGYLLMLAARAITVWLLTIGARLPWRWRQLTWWGGLRGALSIALALLVADTKISTVAYGMVVLSLLIQGGLLRPFAKTVPAELEP
jgi:monovalent cation:H+ antiporter, CPA1 family